MRAFGWGLLVAMTAGNVAAQDVSDQRLADQRPTGRFLTDSFAIGQPLRYALSFDHPATQDAFFPDTGTAFRPLLVRSVALFPTKTQNGISRDSAVYTLVAFETAPALIVKLPVWLRSAGDCTVHFTPTDTVFLQSRLNTTRPDTLALRTQTALVPVPQQFNYPNLGLALGVTVLVAGFVYLLFGKSIRRRWRQYQQQQRHLRFISGYNRLIRGMQPETAAEQAGQAVVRWKRYIEQLEQRPFQSLTTREIAEQLGDPRLADALREIDRLVYSGAFSEQSAGALRVLRDVAAEHYDRQMALLRTNKAPKITLADA